MNDLITASEASQRILAAADEGRLIQGKWHTERDGRELACMLGAIDQGIQSPADCPAAVMQPWLAHVVVTMFDRQSATDAIAWARRFGAQMAHPRWLEIGWDHIRNEWLIGVITNALEAARKVADKEVYWAQVEDAHRQVVAVLRGDAANAANAAYAAAYAAYAANAAALCDIIDKELANA